MNSPRRNTGARGRFWAAIEGLAERRLACRGAMNRLPDRVAAPRATAWSAEALRVILGVNQQGFAQVLQAMLVAAKVAVVSVLQIR
jgi:hypothetical protein